MAAKQENPVCVWDFTCWEDYSAEDLRKILSDSCKKYCFQLEDAGSGPHWQGRISLKAKSRLSGVNKILTAHWSVTSGENRDNNFYACKEDTRVCGPFKDDDILDIPLPRQLACIETWRPWQQSVIDSADVFDTRSINVVVDLKGNIGKSSLALYLTCLRKSCYVPFIREFRDLMRMVMDMPKLGMYMVDLPRALKKEHLREMWSAIETIKSGYAFDDRYNFKFAVFDSPVIWIFTNEVPDLSYQSEDRWRLWEVDDNNDLVKFTPQQEIHEASVDLGLRSVLF